MPATMYAVTFGNFRSFVTRVIKKPLIRMIASARITAEMILFPVLSIPKRKFFR